MTFHTQKIEQSWFETYIHHRRKAREGLTWCIRHVPLKTWKSPSTVSKCKSRKTPSCKSCGSSSVTSTTAFALNFTPRAKLFCPICSPKTRRQLDLKSVFRGQHVMNLYMSSARTQKTWTVHCISYCQWQVRLCESFTNCKKSYKSRLSSHSV